MAIIVANNPAVLALSETQWRMMELYYRCSLLLILCRSRHRDTLKGYPYFGITMNSMVLTEQEIHTSLKVSPKNFPSFALVI